MRTGAFLVIFSLGLLTGCWGSGQAKSEAAKRDAFHEVLGFAPPRTVTEIRSSYFYMRDSYIRWLRFKCDVDTFREIQEQSRLVAATGDNPRWAPGIEDRSQNPNAPDWWWEVEDKVEFREFEREVSRDHGSDRAHVWFDSATSTVFAARDVID